MQREFPYIEVGEANEMCQKCQSISQHFSVEIPSVSRIYEVNPYLPAIIVVEVKKDKIIIQFPNQ